MIRIRVQKDLSVAKDVGALEKEEMAKQLSVGSE